MADTAILKEFLVKLGFKVDEKGLKNFTTGVDDATKGVVRLVATIQGAALTIGAGVSAMASKLEGLYFVSQRTGAAASSLKAFEYAARNLGISSQAAFGTVENLAKFLRENPAGENYLQAIGVQTRDANGQLRDTVDILSDLGQEMGKRPTWLAAQYGNVLGIDQNLLLAMRNGDFARYMQQYREMSKNNGLDKAAEDAHQFMIQLRDLGTTFENFAIRLEGALVQKIGPKLQSFRKWFEKNSPAIADRIASIASAIIDAAAAMGPPLAALADIFISLDKATDGWITKILLAIAAFKILGGFQLVSGIWRMATALRAMGAASAAASAATAGGAAAGGAGAAAAGGGLLARLFPWLARAGVGLGLLLHSGDLNSGEEEELARRRAAAGIAPSGAAPKSAIDAVGFFQRMGWSRDQAAGIVANLRAESNLNHQAVGDGGNAYGVGQWHPDRQANFQAWAGKDIRESSLMEQLQFVNYELTQGAEQRAGQLLRAAQNAQQAGDIVSRYYERPADREGEAARRGAAAVEMSQQTNINIYGVSDAGGAAQSVSAAQRGVNADIVRNLQGAIQ
ncbi:phage tail tip lysozyme [Herbaspirillum robiniae]|uniref:phage tail tip lysozyme n=1 Tax=Herbaspirillum robiniae TaxID=2014887 RepID=UPI0009A1BC6A|nr:phage tail tip lysozyme [Herbaspirillum robiniae]